MDKIIEGNRLIAEFMGLQTKINSRGFLHTIPDEYLNFEYVCYDSSWTWLMPVVENIESISNNIIDSVWLEIIETECEICIFYKPNNRLMSRPFDLKKTYFSCERKIQSVYQAVVEFIKWYNTQNK